MSKTLLADNIKAFQDELIPGIPEATLNILMSELQTLIATGIAEISINKSNTFPAFSLPNADNELRSFTAVPFTFLRDI